MTQSTPSDLSDSAAQQLLPPLLQDIAGLIGVAATMALVKAYGGVRVYIPTQARATPEHPMAAIVGHDNLQALAREYGGLPHFQLPKAERAIKAMRNAEIARAYASNKSARELALAYGLTEGQIVRIASQAGAAAPPDRRQRGLF